MEEETNTPVVNSDSNRERKSSIAKIIITKADNHEEHIEFTQPITIKYMGQVVVNNQTNYYTPTVTPNNSPRVSCEGLEHDFFVRSITRRKSDPILIKSNNQAIDYNESKFLNEVLTQQNALKEGSSIENRI